MKQQSISEIRAFNRFYTNILGLLDQHILDSKYSLPEVRVMYELYHREHLTARDIMSVVSIDKGYLSRVLRQLEKEKLISKKRSDQDGREIYLSLTKRGRTEFEILDEASNNQLRNLLGTLTRQECDTLAANMTEIKKLLSKNPESNNEKISLNDIIIRTKLMPGDLGYIIHRHGKLYSQEYGYGISFEAYVASGIAEFYKAYDPERDRAWICEHGEKIIGFLVLMHRENNAAQLRYFYLEPKYRGIGLGKRLMTLLMDFLAERSYQSCYLWTTHEQTAAASLYDRYGFMLSEEKESTAFGKLLREQRYELTKQHLS